MSHYGHASEFLEESNRWEGAPPQRVEVDPIPDNLAFPDGTSKKDGYRSVFAQMFNVEPGEVQVRFGDTVGPGRHAIVRAWVPYSHPPFEKRVTVLAKPGETVDEAQARYVASLAPKSWAAPVRGTETDA